MQKVLKKGLTFILLLAVLSVSLFTVACGKKIEESNDEGGQAAPVEVYAPDGAPALSLAKFIADNENFGTGADFNYHIVSASDIGAALNKGSGDIVVAPVNLASKLYKANGYKMAAVVTHGNLYIMAKEDLTLNDLVGKVVGVVNIANVPGLTFKALLDKNGIAYEESDTAVEGKVALKGYNDGSELIPALKKNVVTVGLLPEPAANRLTAIAEGYKYAIDIQESFGSYPQAVLMVKSGLIEKYPNMISAIRLKFDGAAEYIEENVETAVTAVNGALAEGLTPSLTTANLNATVIENCKIYWQDGASAKEDVSRYIEMIRAIVPASANVPEDDFYI